MITDSELTNKRQCLIELHDKIKNFPNRNDLYDQTLLGTWRSNFSQYLELFSEAVKAMGFIDIVKKNLPDWWAHDILGAIYHIRRAFIDADWIKEYGNNIVPDLNCTWIEFDKKTNIGNLTEIMLWLEGLLGDIHRYIEFEELDSVNGVDTGCVSIPHNGYYYRWLCRYKKKDNIWEATGFDYIEPIDKTIKQ